MKEKAIKITQKDIDELKEKLKNEIDTSINHMICQAEHRERCSKYKLKLKVGDSVVISSKNLFAMGHRGATQLVPIRGKITKIERSDDSYPPYVAYIDTKFGENLFGIGWMKKAKA